MIKISRLDWRRWKSPDVVLCPPLSPMGFRAQIGSFCVRICKQNAWFPVLKNAYKINNRTYPS